MPRPLALRRPALIPALAILLLSLAACTAAAPSVPTPGPTTDAAPLPGCDEVTTTLGELVGPLAFDQEASDLQTAPEPYDQRVCVYTASDTHAQLSVTLATIPFDQARIDEYATQPGAITDDRLAEHNGVLLTLDPNDPTDGLLDSPLYLYDTRYSVTIYPVSVDAPISTVLPGLTVDAAVDAAVALRAMLG